MEYTLCPILPDNLPAFAPYLMPEALAALAEGDDQVRALGLVGDGAVTCGACALLDEDGEQALLSLYVEPQSRRQGWGGRLLAELSRGGPLWVQWNLPQPDFDALAAFFRSQGCTCAQPNHPVYRLESASLRAAPLLRGAFSPGFRPDGNIVPYGALIPDQRRELLEDASIPSWLHPGGFAAEDLVEEMSLCYVYGGRVTAFFLIGQAGPGEVSILSSLTRPGGHPASFLQLVSAALHAGRARFGGDFICWLDAADQRTEELARQLAGGQLTPWWSGEATREENGT